MPEIHPMSVVETDDIADDVVVGPFTYVGRGSRLEGGVILHPSVTVAAGSIIGEGTVVFPGTFIGKQPEGAGALVRKPEPQGPSRIGTRCAVGPHAVLYAGSTIGDDTLVGEFASIREQVTIGNRCLLSRRVSMNFDVTVGDDTRILDLSGLTGPNGYVGRHVFISVGVICSNDQLMGREGYGAHIQGPHIDDGAFIGLGAILLPGVRIGRDAIVGAGSVVTKNVEPGTRVIGMPARRIPG